MLEHRVGTGLSALLLYVVLVLASSEDAGAQRTLSGLPRITIEHFLPVHTEKMRVGDFEARRRATGVVRPFFLVGADDYSLAWLIENHDRLVQLQAFGLVVEVSDAAAYRRVEAAASGLVVRPVSADLIAKHLGVERYPALITAELITP